MPTVLRQSTLRAVLLALLTTLLWVQTVGLLHRVAHAQKSTMVSKHLTSRTSGPLAALWGEHGNSAECQLFDQACPDLLEINVWIAIPPLVLLMLGEAVLVERFALFDRLYAARGPPVTLN
jgi:hypothetical protein